MPFPVVLQGVAPLPDGTYLVPATKTDLLLAGLVSGRPWLIRIPALAAWTRLTWPGRGSGWPAAGYFAAQTQELTGLGWMLSAYLDEPFPGALLDTSAYYHALEATEKTQASARLGFAVAGILSAAALGVPVMHHIERLHEIWGVDFSGAKRADYAGLDLTYDWVVVEAKGKSLDRVGPSFIKDAKAQAKATLGVAGSPIRRHAASVALLGKRLDPVVARPLGAWFVDPPAIADDTMQEGDDAGGALEEARYGPVALALALGLVEHRHGSEFGLIALDALGYLGVHPAIEDVVLDAVRAPRGPRAFADRVREARRALNTRPAPQALERVGGAAPDVEAQRALALAPTAPLEPAREGFIVAGPRTVEVDGVEHDLAVGADGIALLLRSSLLRDG